MHLIINWVSKSSPQKLANSASIQAAVQLFFVYEGEGKHPISDAAFGGLPANRLRAGTCHLSGPIQTTAATAITAIDWARRGEFKFRTAVEFDATIAEDRANPVHRFEYWIAQVTINGKAGLATIEQMTWIAACFSPGLNNCAAAV